MSLKFPNLSQAKQDLKSGLQDYSKRVSKRSRATMQRALEEAQDNAPKLTGALAESGELTEQKTPNGTRYTASFGGGPVDYAGIVHAENRFLERAMLSMAKELPEVGSE